MSSLALLDRISDDAVTAQLNDPVSFAANDPQMLTRVSGISVLDSARIDERRQRLETYNEDKVALQRRLQEAGVTYLAILPKVAWANLAREADLFRFTPDKDGKVKASAKVLDEAGMSAARAINLRCMLALAIGTVLGGLTGIIPAVAWGFPVWGIAATIVVGAVLGAWSHGHTVSRRYFKAGKVLPAAVIRHEERSIRRLLARPKDKLLRTLWPQDYQPARGDVTLQISLPPAPVEMQDNLVRASKARFPLQLYTVAEAITFDEDPVQAYLSARAPYWDQVTIDFGLAVEAQQKALQERIERARRMFEERMARRQDDLDRDPIVVVDYESATAVIVQYGDFPIEEQLIERILFSDQLI